MGAEVFLVLILFLKEAKKIDYENLGYENTSRNVRLKNKHIDLFHFKIL